MRLGLISYLIISYSLLSQENPKSQISLDGFYLGQYRSVFVNNFGKPIKRMDTQDGWIYEFYKVTSDTSVYLSTKVTEEDTNSVYSIQLNGHNYEDMIPFLGLKLGDSENEIFRILGKYETVEVLDKPPVKVYFFPNRNYSVEVDEAGQLYGIQILGFKGFEELGETAPELNELKQVVLKRDIEKIIDLLMPNFEIYYNNEAYNYTDRPFTELSNESSKLHQIFFKQSNSVYEAFSKEKAKSEFNPRLSFDPNRFLYVIKFPKGKYIDEIVYLGYAGRLRVWEISLKKR